MFPGKCPLMVKQLGRVCLPIKSSKSVKSDESIQHRERDYSRKPRNPRLGSPRPSPHGARGLPEDIIVEHTRLAAVWSRMVVWELRNEDHGIKM